MARRVIGRLRALALARGATYRKRGLHADGGGLYLQVAPSGARSWIFRYRIGGRSTPRDMGLGALASVPLADAREAARLARVCLKEGRDPIEARKASRAKATLDAAQAMTFKDCATVYIEAHKDGWRSEIHAAQWPASLEAYAYPIIGDLAVSAIDVGLVLKVLTPIWKAKPETASRVRGRIEAVLDWARARGYRTADNAARWRGNIDHLLPPRAKVRAVKHYAALAFDEVGAFVAELRKQEGVAARGLEFLILTAARTSEVTGAIPDEIDRAKATWTIPRQRIKAGREHRVPLSPRALAIIEEIAPLSGEYVFPGGKAKRPLSENAFLSLLKRMGRDDITTHGFRSAFKDWAAERTSYSNEVSEMALAHAVPSGVERAYRRGDLLEKRQRLMTDWARFCSTVKVAGEVVPIREQSRAGE